MRVFFSVGEPSGDLHGANLIRELRARCPELEAVGYGGPKMEAAGCQLHTDLTQLAIMAFVLAIANLHKFLGLLLRADRYFREHRPDAVVLIDYPGFNWWIARRAKAHGIPVIYYGTPQLWAWASWRVKKMRRFVDHAICKLPFEVEWLEQRQCRATFVGHPYFDQLAKQTLDAAFLESQRNLPGRLVALLPGSRTQEVKSHLPTLLKVAHSIQREQPDIRFAVASYSPRHAALAREIFEQLPAEERPRVEWHVERTQEVIHLATCCVACSGSVSLELMYHAKPTVIFYQTTRFGMVMQHFLRKTNYITLVNLLAVRDRFREGWAPVYDPDAEGAVEAPFPEYLTGDDCSDRITHWVRQWLAGEGGIARRVEWLRDLRSRFGHPGASGAAADYILKALGRETTIPRRAA